jgi:hypothetical protein
MASAVKNHTSRSQHHYPEYICIVTVITSDIWHDIRLHEMALRLRRFQINRHFLAQRRNQRYHLRDEKPDRQEFRDRADEPSGKRDARAFTTRTGSHEREKIFV